MFGAEKGLDAVRVTIHRGLDGRERCDFGSLTIAIKSRTPSPALRASNSPPNGGAAGPGMTRADRRVRRTPGPRSASSTRTTKTEPANPGERLVVSACRTGRRSVAESWPTPTGHYLADIHVFEHPDRVRGRTAMGRVWPS